MVWRENETSDTWPTGFYALRLPEKELPRRFPNRLRSQRMRALKTCSFVSVRSDATRSFPNRKEHEMKQTNK